jgi:ABC-2 type transport system ATP-binding protein
VSAPAARARGLVKRFPGITAVDGLSLDVEAGECLGLLGPNGAGKTTTVEMLEGLTVPDAGTVELFGTPWRAGHDDALRARIGVQLQETQLPERLHVDEVLELFESFHPRSHGVETVLEWLTLGEKRHAPVGKLSGGQRQRLALGCALIGRPELVFLDEPTTGLDPQARRNVWAVVERFLADGGTACLTTHYMEEAAELCDRIAIVDHGRVIALGTPDALIAELDAPERLELECTPAADAALFEGLPGLVGVERGGDGDGVARWTLAVQRSSTLLPALLERCAAAGVRLERIAMRHATLEDLFLARTGRALRDG